MSRRLPRGLWIFVIVGLTAIVLGSLTGAFIGQNTSRGTGPSQTVQRFFTALARNDAAAALAELAEPPQDRTFLTDEVLRIGHEQAPLTEIMVPATSSNEVPVSYRIGDRPITDSISVRAVGNGFKIITEVNDGGVPIGSQRRTPLDMKVAGQSVLNEQIVLFPGSYPLASSSPNLRYGTTDRVDILRLSDSLVASNFSVQLTDRGKKAAQDAVVASLQACAAQNSFAPEGCPFSVDGAIPNGADPATSSWQILSDPGNDMTITLGKDDLTKSSVQLQLRVQMNYTPGATADSPIYTRTATGTLDLMPATPTVTWQ